MDLDSVQLVNIFSAKSGEANSRNFHCYYKDIAIYKDWSGKINPIGEKHVCRFCGEKDRKKFSKVAHSFPEFAGNKWLFSLDECDNCNDLFSKYENELANASLVMRTLLGMSTKKKSSPKYKNNKISLERKNGGFQMTVNPDWKDDSLGTTEIHADLESGSQNAIITLPEKEHIPLYLFKALVKMAFSIMPKEELDSIDFSMMKSWLINFESGLLAKDYEPFFNIFHNRFEFGDRQPLLILFKKVEKYNDLPMPTYSFIFMYGNQAYQIFLPYVSTDEFIKTAPEMTLLVIPEIAKEKGEKLHFDWVNATSRERIRYKNLQFIVRGKKRE